MSEKMRVWWKPQVPMEKTFYVDVKTVEEAAKLLDVLAHYDLFQYNNNIKPDYANVGGLEVWHEGDQEWEDWMDEETGEDDPKKFIEMQAEVEPPTPPWRIVNNGAASKIFLFNDRVVYTIAYKMGQPNHFKIMADTRGVKVNGDQYNMAKVTDCPLCCSLEELALVVYKMETGEDWVFPENKVVV